MESGLTDDIEESMAKVEKGPFPNEPEIEEVIDVISVQSGKSQEDLGGEGDRIGDSQRGRNGNNAPIPDQPEIEDGDTSSGTVADILLKHTDTDVGDEIVLKTMEQTDKQMK